MQPLRTITALLVVLCVVIACSSCSTARRGSSVRQILATTREDDTLTTLVCVFKSQNKLFKTVLVFGADMFGVDEYKTRNDTMAIRVPPGSYKLCAYDQHPTYLYCVDERDYEVGKAYGIDFDQEVVIEENTRHEPLQIDQIRSNQAVRDSVDSNAIVVSRSSKDSVRPSTGPWHTSSEIEILVSDAQNSEPINLYIYNKKLMLFMYERLTTPPYRIHLPYGLSSIRIWRDGSTAIGFLESMHVAVQGHYVLTWKE
jgi:hypothetical protein